MKPTIAYTDGACKGNGKQTAAAGGYGVYITYANGDEQKIWGGESDTTNNRMELMAAIKALEYTAAEPFVQVFTDSEYVKNIMTKWLDGWKNRGWKKADKKTPENLDLIQTLDTLRQNRNIDWQWVKGHAGHAGNEMADSLANLGVNGHGEEFVPFHQPNTNTASDNTSQALTNQTLSQNENQNTTTNTNHTMTDTHSTEPSTVAQTDTPPTHSNFLWHESEQNPAYDGDTSRYNPDFWAILPQPINRGRAERELIMDTETTGFDPMNGDRIVEIGIVEMIGRKFTGQKLHVYINPEREIPEDSIRVHGIRNEFVVDKPKFADIAKIVFEFMDGADVIAHNARFDYGFFDAEFARVGLPKLSDRTRMIDSLVIAKNMFPGQKNSLDALVKRLDVGKKDRTYHGALLDSEILAEVYLAMTGGQVSLDMSTDSAGDNSEMSEHQNLSHLSSLLARSLSDNDGDTAWRAALLK